MNPDPELFSAVLSIVAAVGLSAACGFRVFVPLLMVSMASRAELIALSDGFAWIGSTPAVLCFGAATLLEVVGYYVPVVDNFLDAVATPAAVIAGVLVSAAVIVDVDPWLKWTLAVIAGGGAAAAVQVPTVLARGASTASTAGVGNSLVSTTELVASSGFSVASVMAFSLPFLVPFVALALVWFVYRRLKRRGEPGQALVVG
jgi:hypothetical protein